MATCRPVVSVSSVVLPNCKPLLPDTISKLDRIEAAIVSLGQIVIPPDRVVLAIEEKLKSARKLLILDVFGPESPCALGTSASLAESGCPSSGGRTGTQYRPSRISLGGSKNWAPNGPDKRLSEIVDTPATHADLSARPVDIRICGPGNGPGSVAIAKVECLPRPRIGAAYDSS